MKRPRMLRLLGRLKDRIVWEEDEVRCYRLPENTETVSLGRQYFSETVMLFTSSIDQILGNQTCNK
jgi:CRISPR-associated protein Cas2